MKKWFLKHWILSSFLILVFASSIMSGFEKGREDFRANTIPDYTIIDQTDLINGNKLVEVLITSISNDTPKNEIQEVASNISSKYSAQQVQIYCSLEAQKANYSSSFAEENPTAIEECFLGEYNF